METRIRRKDAWPFSRECKLRSRIRLKSFHGMGDIAYCEIIKMKNGIYNIKTGKNNEKNNEKNDKFIIVDNRERMRNFF